MVIFPSQSELCGLGNVDEEPLELGEKTRPIRAGLVAHLDLEALAGLAP